MPGEDYQSWSTTAANNDTADTSVNWREGMARAAVNDSARSEMAAHAKNRNLQNGSIVTTGLPNQQNFASGVGYITAVPPNMRVMLKIGTGLTNTDAVTLNMDGIGDVTVKNQKGADLGPGDLLESSFAEFLYNGTNWIARPGASPSSISGVNIGDGGGGDVGDGGGPASGHIGGGTWETSGTYIPSPNMVFCTMELIGGGGGGAGVIGAAAMMLGGGGGGGGGFSRKMAKKATIGTSQVVTVGAGGAAGAIGADGGHGGDTSVGALATAGGGRRGTGTIAGGNFPQGGNGGTPGTGDITGGGGGGHAGVYLYLVGGQGTGGHGGESILGGGGQGVAPGDSQAVSGAAGSHYGGGGAGACARNIVGGGNTGGAGAPGVVIITEFVS